MGQVFAEPIPVVRDTSENTDALITDLGVRGIWQDQSVTFMMWELMQSLICHNLSLQRPALYSYIANYTHWSHALVESNHITLLCIAPLNHKNVVQYATLHAEW